MTIYLDEIFVINLLMDALLIWATGVLLQRPLSFRRLIASAALGAVYGVIIFLPYGIWLANGVAKGICALLMVWIGFGWGSWQAFIKAVIYLYLASFALGGGIIALMYFGGQRIVQTWNGLAIMEVEFSLFWLIAGAVLILVLVNLLHKSIHKNLEQALQIVSVSVQLRNKVLQLRLLVDSGNCLTDPISGIPAIVVQMRYVESLFSENEFQQIMTGTADAALCLPELADRIRLLPFQTVGYRGLMLGVRLDELQIRAQKYPAQVISKADIVMALSPQQFASDGAYHGIISPLLLQVM